MGINNTKLSPNTEDWNNINTADMSSADMKLVNIRSDAQALVSILPNTESETFIDSPTNNLYNRIYLSIKEGNKNSEMARTDTSPFISEDMYNYLVESSSEKNNISESFKFSESSNVNVRNNFVGGGKVETSTTLSNLSNIKSNSSNIKIENATSSSKFNDFELEHSSLEYQGDTSSSKKSVLMSDSISSKNSSHANNSSSNNSSSNNSSSNNSSYRSSVQKTESLKTVSDVTITSDYNRMQGGGVQSLKYNSDYESSSAHTSSSSSNNSSIINKESSYNETTISVGNQKILSDSINTSDINIITVDH